MQLHSFKQNLEGILPFGFSEVLLTDLNSSLFSFKKKNQKQKLLCQWRKINIKFFYQPISLFNYFSFFFYFLVFWVGWNEWYLKDNIQHLPNAITTPILTAHKQEGWGNLHPFPSFFSSFFFFFRQTLPPPLQNQSYQYQKKPKNIYIYISINHFASSMCPAVPLKFPY